MNTDRSFEHVARRYPNHDTVGYKHQVGNDFRYAILQVVLNRCGSRLATEDQRNGRLKITFVRNLVIDL